MITPDLIAGIMGNIISILVYAAPIGTFWEVVKNKSVENYDVLPYIMTLLCKSLWTFYGAVDPADGLLIITVNSVGVLTESIYIIIYLIYAPKDKKVKTLILVGTLNIAFVGAVIALAVAVFHEECKRRTFMGVLCATVTIAMYAAPLKAMRNVIKTKSVEYMPFFLSFVLLLNAGCWFTFAAILRDYYVIVPNAVGILSSSSQIILYIMYKNKSKSTVMDEELGSLKLQAPDMKMQIFEDHKSEIKQLKEAKSLPKLELAGQYGIKRSMRTFSLSPYELHYYPPMPTDIDVENETRFSEVEI